MQRESNVVLILAPNWGMKSTFETSRMLAGAQRGYILPANFGYIFSNKLMIICTKILNNRQGWRPICSTFNKK